ncbi:hypothetical protein Pcinc_031480 [Petrolisthes cinctipes]|uniref:Uncharacterized protein n=1 Tax=Petrolisthes cinctipes TaxID=88211 RepID=A0AAE1EW24_PETCI|nr:hypothetical protein Pcinc_031480 [Petrolisthes cinctipes]
MDEVNEYEVVLEEIMIEEYREIHAGNDVKKGVDDRGGVEDRKDRTDDIRLNGSLILLYWTPPLPLCRILHYRLLSDLLLLLAVTLRNSGGDNSERGCPSRPARTTTQKRA